MSTTLAPPNAELVAQAWVGKYVPGIVPAMIAGSLPPIEAWTSDGFLTIRALGSGSPDPELGQRRMSVLQVDAWAAKGGKVRPLWGVAQVLLERIRVATFADVQVYGKPLGMPVGGYQTARVLAAYLTREPVRVEGDPSGFAHMTTDLAVDWTV